MKSRFASVKICQATVEAPATDGRVERLLGPVDLDFPSGEAVAIIGPSAAGKSTLLKLIAGLIAPSEGSVCLEGCASQARLRIALAPQSPALLPWLTVTQNVILPAQLGDSSPARQAKARARAAELLHTFGLGDSGNSYPGTLSGGMQSRVALARALTEQPDLLLLDEPFGSLDEITAETIMLDLEGARGGCTMLLVSHNIAQAVFLANRIVVLSPSPGRVLGELRIDAPHPRPASFLDGPEAAAATAKARQMLRIAVQ